ncbi:DUF3558 domain-containing protein [Pseudonocardia hydrocarbonoxydans]|uniref:DUF3558 domain-containing protein n=1 Tax=Pseudonocardia hydrocarbonoxydans TaxID=76726 RepID=UPI001477742C|nr:DUF3558 domain-containing protein [Pseudonocardia hydrocarbonoxydans]
MWLLTFSIVLATTGCSSATVPGVGAPVESVSPVPAQGEPPRWAPSVRSPRDARGVPPCDVLSEEQIRELGFLPDTAVESINSTTQSCGWSSATDDTNPVGLEINSDSNLAALDIVHNLRETFARFEPTEVGGHPAIRADDLPDNGCALYIAIADHQGISIEYNAANRPLPDPCEIPRRMGAFILANLPPLT